jgi:hypothetical protein
MSKSFLFFLLIAAAAGFYLYKTNWFTDIRATFDYAPEGISITAREMDLHDCKLKLTHDYSVDLPFLRQNTPRMVGKDDFKQWNGTMLESIQALGPEIEFRMRCTEGAIDLKETNRYYTTQ